MLLKILLKKVVYANQNLIKIEREEEGDREEREEEDSEIEMR